MNVIGVVVIAVAAVAAIVVLGIHGTISGQDVFGLLSAIVTGGFTLAAHQAGTSSAVKTILSTKPDQPPTA